MGKQFYTYVFYIDGVPEYVGKGHADRLVAHLARATKSHWSNHVLKSLACGRVITIVIHKADSEHEAFDKEVELIAMHGRRDLGTGSLYNLTNGGEGDAGAVRTEETKAKMRKPKSPEHRANIAKARLGTKMPKTEKMTAGNALVAIKNTGGRRTDEQKARMSAAQIRSYKKGRR